MGIKKALITGASAGIGKELALILKREGIHVIAVGRNLAKLKEVSEVAVSADLSTPEGISKIKDIIEKEELDLVVNNAGVGKYGSFLEHDLEMIQTNCHALVALTQAAAKSMRGRGGTILNVSSALAFFPTPGATVYAATKSFVNSFSIALHEELKQHSINVLCACPGQVATDFRVHASSGRVSRPKAGGLILDPQLVAASIWKQILTKKTLQIIDWRYKLLVGLSRFYPQKLVMKILSNIMKSR